MAVKSQPLFSLVSYNCHGINQGSPMLSQLCNVTEFNADIICLQELWLTPSNIHRIESFNQGYSFYGRSGMEDSVSCGVLKGRPFGGVGILVKKRSVSSY